MQVGERVELRPALIHPSLPRPVAYLGDLEMARLIGPLAEHQTPQVLRAWSHWLPPERARAAVAWFDRLGMWPEHGRG